MSFNIKYQPLFAVDILHSFFLDKGTDEYIAMNADDKKEQLKKFQSSDFISIVPDSETLRMISGYSLVFKPTNTGLTVWTKMDETTPDLPFIIPLNGLCFTFLIRLKDQLFYNYSDVDLDQYGKLFYFSNRRLAGESNSFPLIKLSGDNSFISSDFVLSDDGAENELLKLNEAEKQQLFGIVRIYISGENSSLDILDANHKIPQPPKYFEIFFNNRKTIWRYIFHADQAVKNKDDVKKENGNSRILITKTEKPLTKNGFVSIKLDKDELPNPAINMIKPDNVSHKNYSEIYM
ncbi:MAG: hypothetical protein JXR61_05310 [Prolixibacteraceae bacterium]|nr:hypothetical protein [Prolixibacteraceae bacterium]